jgi:hypothetical protein
MFARGFCCFSHPAVFGLRVWSSHGSEAKP